MYRALNESEVPGETLRAKAPEAEASIDSHVRNGSKPGYVDQFISATMDLQVALQRFGGAGAPVVEIDLSKVSAPTINLANPDCREEVLESNYTKHLAERAAEVLIEGDVLPPAYQVIRP